MFMGAFALPELSFTFFTVVSNAANCDVPNRLYGGRSNTINNIRTNNGSSVSDDDNRSMGSK